MQLAKNIPSVDGAYMLTHGVHTLPNCLLVYWVSMESPEALTPALLALATDICYLAERLHRVQNYRRKLIQVARRHGIYPITLEGKGYVAHRFTDGEASLTLRLSYRKARKPSNP